MNRHRHHAHRHGVSVTLSVSTRIPVDEDLGDALVAEMRALMAARLAACCPGAISAFSSLPADAQPTAKPERHPGGWPAMVGFECAIGPRAHG